MDSTYKQGKDAFYRLKKYWKLDFWRIFKDGFLKRNTLYNKYNYPFKNRIKNEPPDQVSFFDTCTLSTKYIFWSRSCTTRPFFTWVAQQEGKQIQPLFYNNVHICFFVHNKKTLQTGFTVNPQSETYSNINYETHNGNDVNTPQWSMGESSPPTYGVFD